MRWRENDGMLSPWVIVVVLILTLLFLGLIFFGYVHLSKNYLLGLFFLVFLVSILGSYENEKGAANHPVVRLAAFTEITVVAAMVFERFSNG